MRKITISRKKRFVACLIKYECVIDNGSKSGYHIGNGETIIVNTDNKRCELTVYANTSSGIVISDKIIIEPDEGDKNFVLITKYSFFKGSKVIIKEK